MICYHISQSVMFFLIAFTSWHVFRVNCIFHCSIFFGLSHLRYSSPNFTSSQKLWSEVISFNYFPILACGLGAMTMRTPKITKSSIGTSHLSRALPEMQVANHWRLPRTGGNIPHKLGLNKTTSHFRSSMHDDR
jgi:hypothetical protein